MERSPWQVINDPRCATARSTAAHRARQICAGHSSPVRFSSARSKRRCTASVSDGMPDGTRAQDNFTSKPASSAVVMPWAGVPGHARSSSNARASSEAASKRTAPCPSHARRAAASCCDERDHGAASLSTAGSPSWRSTEYTTLTVPPSSGFPSVRCHRCAHAPAMAGSCSSHVRACCP